MKISKINQIAESTPSSTNPDDVSGTLKLFAPLIIVVLQFAKVFTGKDADAKIDEVITFLQGL